MSTAKLNVWITEKGNPCRIDNNPQKRRDLKEPIQLFVYVLHCNGQILEWCGTKYVGLQAKCGHLSLEIPVGCYLVGAVESTGRDAAPGKALPHLGNHLTHIAIVRANCGDEVCVTLFNPTFHHCAHWLGTAIKNHLAVGGAGLQQEANAAMRNTARAVEELVRVLPPDPFTVTQAKELGDGDPAGKGTGTPTKATKTAAKKAR